MPVQFSEIIALPSPGKNCMCSMSCAGNATSSEKFNLKSNLLTEKAIYLSANLAIAPCSWVAIFPCNGNAIMSEICIVIAGEKLLV